VSARTHRIGVAEGRRKSVGQFFEEREGGGIDPRRSPGRTRPGSPRLLAWPRTKLRPGSARSNSAPAWSAISVAEHSGHQLQPDQAGPGVTVLGRVGLQPSAIGLTKVDETTDSASNASLTNRRERLRLPSTTLRRQLSDWSTSTTMARATSSVQ